MKGALLGNTIFEGIAGMVFMAAVYLPSAGTAPQKVCVGTEQATSILIFLTSGNPLHIVPCAGDNKLLQMIQTTTAMGKFAVQIMACAQIALAVLTLVAYLQGGSTLPLNVALTVFHAGAALVCMLSNKALGGETKNPGIVHLVLLAHFVLLLCHQLEGKLVEPEPAPVPAAAPASASASDKTRKTQ